YLTRCLDGCVVGITDEGSIATLLARREDVARHFRPVSPFDLENASITEERSPYVIPDVDDDSAAAGLLVLPLPNVSGAPEKHREAEADDAFVESLRARAQPHSPIGVDRQVDIDGEVFMRSEVVDNPAARVAVNHVGIESSRAARRERADPRDGLASKPI